MYRYFKYFLLLIVLLFASPLNAQVCVSIKDFGAKGDGFSDDTKSIQRALDYVENRGGGIVTVPKSTSSYIVSESLAIGSNSTLRWDAPVYFKLIRPTTSGVVLTSKSVVKKSGITINIKIINPHIDVNNISTKYYGQNGVGFAHSHNVLVDGGRIINAKKGGGYGGKGVGFESGVRNCKAQNLTIEYCDYAIFTQGVSGKDKYGRTMEGTDILFANITSNYCGTFLYLACTTSPPPVDEKVTKCRISGFNTYDTGSAEGFVVVDRYSNAVVEGGKIDGSNSYIVKNLLRGRGANIMFQNVAVKVKVESMLESKIITGGGTSIQNVNWNINNIDFIKAVDNITLNLQNIKNLKIAKVLLPKVTNQKGSKAKITKIKGKYSIDY